jgi:hypothetical protein
MDFVYVFVVDGAEWEDLIIFLSKEEAIAKSIECPKVRLEIFAKSTKGYIPTYNYYLNGKFVRTI